MAFNPASNHLSGCQVTVSCLSLLWGTYFLVCHHHSLAWHRCTRYTQSSLLNLSDCTEGLHRAGRTSPQHQQGDKLRKLYEKTGFCCRCSSISAQRGRRQRPYRERSHICSWLLSYSVHKPPTPLHMEVSLQREMA